MESPATAELVVDDMEPAGTELWSVVAAAELMLPVESGAWAVESTPVELVIELPLATDVPCSC